MPWNGKPNGRLDEGVPHDSGPIGYWSPLNSWLYTDIVTVCNTPYTIQCMAEFRVCIQRICIQRSVDSSEPVTGRHEACRVYATNIQKKVHLKVRVSLWIKSFDAFESLLILSTRFETVDRTNILRWFEHAGELHPSALDSGARLSSRRKKNRLTTLADILKCTNLKVDS